MTKKAAALLLAASLAVSVCAMPVFAADTAHAGENVSGTTPTNTTTTVKYEVTEGYKWAIPATIDFGKDAGLNATRTVDANQAKGGNYQKADTNVHGESGNVYVSDCRLKPGTKLTISISSTTTMYNATDGFYVKTTNNGAIANNIAKVPYAIYKGTVTDPATATPENKLDNSSVILKLNAGTDYGKQDLTFILSTGDAEIAGEYEGTVAFAAKVDNATT